MEPIQALVVSSYGFFALSGFFRGLHQCIKKKNPYGLTYPYNLIGAFVWADTVVFGLFWSIASFVSIILNSWLLFLLTFSVFWLIRSIGETIYWFNQQFAVRDRNPYHTLILSKIFPGDSSWVALQIIWQCIAVATTISSIYLIKLWLQF